MDLRGYANCGTEHRPNFANSAPSIADIDGDGTLEICRGRQCLQLRHWQRRHGDLAYLPFIFNADRSRWVSGGSNWTAIPPLGGTSGKALSEDYNVIQNAAAQPVLADLDGDGVQGAAVRILRRQAARLLDGQDRARQLAVQRHQAGRRHVVRIRAGGGRPGQRRQGRGDLRHLAAQRRPARRQARRDRLAGQSAPADRAAGAAPADASAGTASSARRRLANIDADADLELVVGTVAPASSPTTCPAARARACCGAPGAAASCAPAPFRATRCAPCSPPLRRSRSHSRATP